jgi:hypothetical protein
MRLNASKHIGEALSLSSAWQYMLASTKSGGNSKDTLSLHTESRGGSMFSLCPISSSADLFDITSV